MSKQPLTAEQALNRAAAKCAAQECCVSDIVAACLRWGLVLDEAESVAARLEAEGYIDENRYARAFVHDKVAYDHWGRVKIRAALRQKGISDSDIRAALDTVDEEQYEANLCAFLKAKSKSLPAETDERKGREKVAAAALRRGYEPELVFRQLGF
ncbi:MAG: RecX family transcriptional regulator [Bacteroidaceae bacterium]|nr:RecX family transcriptional regulator [Bacteroidaceae bacterium]